MDAKRRQQQPQQQQLCVQALHQQQMGTHCVPPMGYPASPWVLWDGGHFMEIARRRKKKKRLYTACLLAGIAVVVFAVAGVAGLAVYLGGSPPTENSANWESFRRAGEARYGEDSTTHRLLGRHGVLLRADVTTERTTQPARSPWSIRRDQGIGRWEGRGGGGEEEPQDTVQKMKDEAIELEDPIDLPDEYSEGIPEVEVVLDSAAIEPTGDASEAIENLQSQPHRSPHARASEVVETPTTVESGGDDHKDVTVTPKGEKERPVGSTGVEVVTTISIRESSVRKGGEKDREDDGQESDILRRNERRRGESEWGGAPPEENSEEDEGSVEGLVEEDKRRGGEERRYEQLQVSNKAASGGVPVFNILTKILNRVNTSSGHKEVDTSDKNHANNGTMECSIGEFRCSVPNGGIMCLPGSSRCDGARDCFLNGEDEIGCTCADTLRSRFLHRKLCDGVPDCWDYSDEDQCDWCSPGHLVCGGGSRTCVEPERICDGAKDCPGGDDEARCIALFPEEVHKEAKMMGSEGRRFYHRGSNWNGTTRGSDYVTASMVTNEVLPYRSSGYLLVRKKGVWGKLCMDGPTSSGTKTKDDVKEKHWGVAEIGHEVCKAMTHRDFEMIEQVPDDDIYEGQYSKQTSTPYYKLQRNSSQNDILGSTQSLQTTECSSKKVVRVICRDLECGVRPKVKVNQWSRIVGGGNAAPGAWPWQAALYREGEFQCGATLISDHWLVSAGHCFFRAPDDYWVARMGTLRRGTALPSPHEQRRPVSTIVLHPGYVDEGFLNDIALLRLSSPVEITDHVRPVCLPPHTTHISTTTFRYPDITSSSHSEEKDLDHVPTEEGISYMYDEANTMIPSLLNSYESIQEELNTHIPYTHQIMSEISTMLTDENTTEAFNNYSGEYGQAITTETALKKIFNSTRGNLIVPGQSSTINTNDELQHEIFRTSPYSSNTNYPLNDDELNLEQSTSMTSPFDHQMSENETPDDYSTESMAGHTMTELPQHMNTQSVTEEIDLKELIREVSSLFLSTNSRPLYNNAASKNRNTIQTIDNKGKYVGGDEGVDEATKITFPYEHSSTVYMSHRGQSENISIDKKNAPSSLVSGSIGEISDSNTKDHAVEVSKTDAIETENLKNEVAAEEKISQKIPSDAIEVSTQNKLKLEQVHDKYSNHTKSPHETPNNLSSNDKIVETKHIDRTPSLDTDAADMRAYINVNSTQAKSVSPDTVIFTLEDAVASVMKVGAEFIGSERKIRNAEKHEGTDDGTDDGIRNGRLCTVVGWGQLFEVGKIFPDTLQEVQLPLISTRECRKRTIFLPLYHLTDAMFCAGYDNGGRDACLGDSGGPLMCQEPDGHWSLYGVTSNGYGCARVNRPGVYTKVSHYIPWMEETMLKEDSAQEEKRKREEERWREEVEGGEDLWRREWRKRRGEDGTGGKHHCPHRCPLGECLQKARVCNGVVDCSDASDEQNCYSDTRVGR